MVQLCEIFDIYNKISYYSSIRNWLEIWFASSSVREMRFPFVSSFKIMAQPLAFGSKFCKKNRVLSCLFDGEALRL